MNRQLWVFLLLFVILFVKAPAAFSQEQQEGDRSKFGEAYGVHIGPLLPNQIPGMREIMPTLGARYAYPLTQGHAEIGLSNANAWGTSYYNGSLSYRGDFSLDDIHGLVYIGLDTHYYNPPSEPFQLYFGAMLAAALPFQLATDFGFDQI